MTDADQDPKEMETMTNSRRVAARIWCDPRTSHIEMDPLLAEVMAEKIDQYIDALIWVTGSADFGPGGQARVGWLKLGQPLIDEWLRETGDAQVLSEYERKILRHLNGEDIPELSWGAAMSVAAEELADMGYAEVHCGRYLITEAGRQALQEGGE